MRVALALNAAALLGTPLLLFAPVIGWRQRQRYVGRHRAGRAAGASAQRGEVLG